VGGFKKPWGGFVGSTSCVTTGSLLGFFNGVGWAGWGITTEGYIFPQRNLFSIRFFGTRWGGWVQFLQKKKKGFFCCFFCEGLFYFLGCGVYWGEWCVALGGVGGGGVLLVVGGGRGGVLGCLKEEGGGRKKTKLWYKKGGPKQKKKQTKKQHQNNLG